MAKGAVGILFFFMKFLAKAFELSNCDAAFVGPRIKMPQRSSSSTTPRAKGVSGPTITKSAPKKIVACTILAISTDDSVPISPRKSAANSLFLLLCLKFLPPQLPHTKHYHDKILASSLWLVVLLGRAVAIHPAQWNQRGLTPVSHQLLDLLPNTSPTSHHKVQLHTLPID